MSSPAGRPWSVGDSRPGLSAAPRGNADRRFAGTVAAARCRCEALPDHRCEDTRGRSVRRAAGVSQALAVIGVQSCLTRRDVPLVLNQSQSRKAGNGSTMAKKIQSNICGIGRFSCILQAINPHLAQQIRYPEREPDVARAP